MDLLELMKAMLNESTGFVKSKNYYFENHHCSVKGTNVKVQLNYKIVVEDKDEIVLLGMCPDCKAVFYHEDHEQSHKL